MTYLLDLIVIAIIALFTFIGYKKGLIKVAFGLISFILALIISVIIYKPVSHFIINYTSIDNSIASLVEERLSSPDNTDEETQNIISNYYSNIKTVSISAIAKGISTTIINVGCIILVFIITKLILLFFKFSGDLIAKLPLIKQINHAGGFIYGLLKGFIIIYLLLALIALISPIINIDNILEIINKSIITNIMYNNNIIFILFS